MFKFPKDHPGYLDYELIVSEDCNLRCTYCFDDQLSDRQNKDMVTPKMTLDMIPKIQDFILKTKRKDFEGVHISFFGGEPLMNWEFMKKFVESSKNIFSFKHSFSFGTNATLLDSEKIQWIIDNNIHVTVSLDGKSGTHDKHRVYSGGLPSWQNVLQKLPEMTAKKKNLFGLNMTVNPDTLDTFEEDYAFVQNVSYGSGQILFNFDADWTEERFEKLESIWNGMFLYGNYKLPGSYINRITTPGNCHCILPTRGITISAAGQIFFCHRLVPKMIKVGPNYQDYFGDIENGFVVEEYQDKTNLRTDFAKWSKGKACETCEVAHPCYGGCIAAHQWKMKSIDGLDPINCRINNIIFNKKLQEKVKTLETKNCDCNK